MIESNKSQEFNLSYIIGRINTLDVTTQLFWVSQGRKFLTNKDFD